MAQVLRKFWQWVAGEQPQVADFLCPITSQIMTDPVTAMDNFNYEREAIELWLGDHGTSPQTGKPMECELRTNAELRRAIVSFEQGQSVVSWPAHGCRDPSATRSVTLESASAAAAAAVLAADEGEGRPSKRRRYDSDERANMSEAMSKAFRELDEVRDLLSEVLDGWTPPKIKVIGDESAGKSTILEQLAMLPVFPREKRFCTRLAIELRLRRSPDIHATLSVYSVPAEGPRVPDGDPMQVPQENGWIWVQQKMLSLVEELSAELSVVGIVKDKIIVLEVSRPDVPSIDLVDLPGLTTVPIEKVAEIQAVLERQLAEDERTGGHSMYLAIVPAAGDVRPCTNKAMEFVQKYQLEDKTFGVFSKCDQVSDAEVLSTLVTGTPTEDGYTPAQLGAVNLAKGWVATMLKPPPGKEFRVHNFERILIQQKEDFAWFNGKPCYKDIVESGQAGIGALVERLEREYSNYLNTTWKEGAMKKVLEKLEAKEFDLNMLGVVPEETARDKLARREVERRLGPDSPVKDLHARFMKEVLKGKLCTPALSTGDSGLGALATSVTWEGCDINRELETVKEKITAIAMTAVRQIKDFWTPKLEKIIIAESTVDAVDGENNIVTDCGFARLRLWGKGKAQRKMRKDVKQEPLIQLSHYKEFTNAIVSKCRSLFHDAAQELEGEVDELIQRLIEPDSPWLRLEPELAAPSNIAADGAVNSKVKATCDVQKFVNVLVTLFLRKVPSPRDLQFIHKGVQVGKEEGSAKQKFEELRLEIKKIEAARDGIKKALSISEAEFTLMKSKFDEEPAVQ